MKTRSAIIESSIASLLMASSADAYFYYSGTGSSFTVGDGANATYAWELGGDYNVLLATLREDTNLASHSIRLRFKSTLGVGDFVAVSSKNSNIKALALGYNVNNAANFTSTNCILMAKNTLNSVSGFTSGTASYIGFKFVSGTTTYYGWALITLATGSTYGTVTISEWAYSDETILVGQTAVPEPAETAAGLGALALGAAGLRRWRKGKTAKAA